MVSQKKYQIRIAISLLGLLITGLFFASYFHAKKRINSAEFHGTLLTKPREINPFVLTGTDNQAFNKASLQGQWTMIFFGFTNCAYLCPTTLAELAKMYSILDEKKVKPLPRVVLISLDPKRDTLLKLHAYVQSFNPHFYGASGEEAVVNKLTKELGLAYAKLVLPAVKGEENYEIQHSGAVLLFNPEGKLTAFFTNPQQAGLLAKDYQLLVS